MVIILGNLDSMQWHLKFVCRKDRKRIFIYLSSTPNGSRIALRGVNFPTFLHLLKHLCQVHSLHSIRED